MSWHPYIILAMNIVIVMLAGLLWIKRLRRWLHAIVIIVNLGSASLFLYEIWPNASAGCFPWSPAEVEFYQGMTLCPHQRARVTIPLALPWPNT